MTLDVFVDWRRRVQQRLHDPPRLLDGVLADEAPAVSAHRGVQEHLVGGRPLAALARELHVESDRLRLGRLGPLRIDLEADPGGRVEPDHELVGLGPA